ncbi:MAG TPA: sigma-70 family RNA polymerase sigma factor [Baekduia sp.]|nr:sigma-70 family RNA polymerase sigma factor [Baekduia sp.]
MDETDLLARRFEEHRDHLSAVAYRMLGSRAEADDAVQEAWIRTSRADRDDVENLGGWLTTVVSRVCLNMLDTRRRRREEALDEGRLPDPVVEVGGPEGDAVLADAVGAALLVVLDQLGPAERLAFVLHDLFGLSFDEIAPIVDRTPAAARQLASRARRRVRGADVPSEAGLAQRRRAVDAFLAASREGDFEELLTVLDPDVVLRADDGSGALRILHGARAVAGGASVAGPRGAAGRVVRHALVDGGAGVVFFEDGVPVVIMAFRVGDDGRVTGLDILADAPRVTALLSVAGGV